MAQYSKLFLSSAYLQTIQDLIHIRNYIEVLYELPETITQKDMEERLMMFLDYVRPASWRIKFQPALIQREGGEGKGLVIDSRLQNITQSKENYTERHSYVMDVPDEERAESGVDFSEVFKKNDWRIVGDNNLYNIEEISNHEELLNRYYDTLFYKIISTETKSVKQDLIITVFKS